MTIQKIFSEVGGEEKYYSVLMSEEELRLFSKAVYEGLTAEEAQKLKQKRDALAKALNEKRIQINKELTGGMNEVEMNYLGRGLDNMTESERAMKRAFETNEVQRRASNARKAALNEVQLKSKSAKDLLVNFKPDISKKEIGSTNAATNTGKQAAGFISRNWNKLGTGGKIGVAAAGTAAIGGLGYGAYKMMNKDKK